MKKLKAHKISGWLLGICIVIALVLFSVFYIAYAKSPESISGNQIDGLLFYLFILLSVTTVSVFAFSVYQLIKGGKEYFRRRVYSLISIALLGLLLFFTYQLGNGDPLIILGYHGDENTYRWLKISDMWIFSITVLLGLTILSVLVGILWSYLKRK